MSQTIFNSIDPTTTTGLMLAGLLNDFKDAIVSGFSGTSRPANLQAQGLWVDTTQQSSPNFIWIMKIYNGTTDLEIFRVSVVNGSSGFNLANGEFTIRKISADTVGSILNLVKNRTGGLGQVLNGDTIAELRITGRTNTSTDPIVGYIRATASEDETTSNSGVTLSLVSTPVGTSQLVEHLRFLSGLVETVVPHKLNSYIYGVDTIATSSSILMTADKILSELTGSTPSNIHGIEIVTGDTQVKFIHNRSTADITIKNESGSATAAQRFTLPKGEDFTLLPQSTAGFYYCITDSRWKYISGSIAGVRTFTKTIPSGYTEWTSPITGNIRIASFQEPTNEPTTTSDSSGFARAAARGILSWGFNGHGELGVGDTAARSIPVLVLGGLNFKDAMIANSWGMGLTDTGDAYAWGLNTDGELGVGDTVPRSSPVAVLGGLKFSRVEIGQSSFGITFPGLAYGWGSNANGQLGVGDVVPRSSPVAVLGGVKFAALFHGEDGEGRVFGVARDTGALYGWGVNDHGCLGVGDIASRSSPVAVLGGLKFETLSRLGAGENTIIAIEKATGAAYAWGFNSNGELGVGDVVPRSSPVAVLGSLKFSHISTGDSWSYGTASDGKIYAWGFNGDGQLGDNTIVSKSSPVAVMGIVEPFFEVPTFKVIPVVSGQTYKIKLCGGASFFDNILIGKNVRRAVLAFEN